MPASDLTALVGGPYVPPPVRVGDVATCLYRDCDVVITSWTAARIPWPRCRARGGPGGGSGLLVCEELVRAIRTESAAALRHGFGASHNAVWCWRKAFGVRRHGTPGSARLYAATAAKAAAATRGKTLPAKAVRERRRRAIELDLARHLRAANAARQRRWTAAEARLLGTMSDARLAARLGCSRDAVRRERTRRGVPSWRPYRRGQGVTRRPGGPAG